MKYYLLGKLLLIFPKDLNSSSWLRTQLSEGNQGLPSAWPFAIGSITLHIRPGTIVHFSEGKADALDVEPLNPRTSSGRAGLASRPPKYGCLSVSHGLP